MRKLVWIGLLSALAAGGSAGKPGVPALQLEACRLQHPDRLQSVGARCGSLEVPENPDAPAGRKIRLKIAVVPALNQSGPRDPLFVIAGGPGQGSADYYVSLAGAFTQIQRSRDIVLVDQRGTGGSNPLDCTFPEDDEVADMSPDEVRAMTRKCLEALKGNPAYYTTSIAVRDLERVRIALGYEQVNLYGVSYGTRVAQHYLRRYPDRVRTLVLDGVVPPQQILGTDTAMQAQRSLDLIFERCHNDPACHAAFPDPAADFARLRETLGRAPAQVSFADPTTAAPIHAPVRLIDLQMTVRLLSYNASNAALLPLILHEGAERNNLAPIAAQARMIETQLGEVLSVGMHNAVVCTEDAPFFDAAAPDRHAFDKSYLGTLQLEMLEQICSVWPRGTMDADFHAPLNSQTPALVLTGSADPVTPPAYAEQALKGLHGAVQLLMDGQGHGQLGSGCVPQLMARFIEKGSARELDLSCAKKVLPAPFFTSFSGPAP